MPLDTTHVAKLKADLALAKKKPVNFAFALGKTTADSALEVHVTKSPENLENAAKKIAGNKCTLCGTLEVSGKDFKGYVWTEDKIGGSIAKKIKTFLKEAGFSLKVTLFTRDGNGVLDSDGEEDGEAKPASGPDPKLLAAWKKKHDELEPKVVAAKDPKLANAFDLAVKAAKEKEDPAAALAVAKRIEAALSGVARSDNLDATMKRWLEAKRKLAPMVKAASAGMGPTARPLAELWEKVLRLESQSNFPSALKLLPEITKLIAKARSEIKDPAVKAADQRVTDFDEKNAALEAEYRALNKALGDQIMTSMGIDQKIIEKVIKVADAAKKLADDGNFAIAAGMLQKLNEKLNPAKDADKGDPEQGKEEAPKWPDSLTADIQTVIGEIAALQTTLAGFAGGVLTRLITPLDQMTATLKALSPADGEAIGTETLAGARDLLAATKSKFEVLAGAVDGWVDAYEIYNLRLELLSGHPMVDKPPLGGAGGLMQELRAGLAAAEAKAQTDLDYKAATAVLEGLKSKLGTAEAAADDLQHFLQLSLRRKALVDALPAKPADAPPLYQTKLDAVKNAWTAAEALGAQGKVAEGIDKLNEVAEAHFQWRRTDELWKRFDGLRREIKGDIHRASKAASTRGVVAGVINVAALIEAGIGQPLAEIKRVFDDHEKKVEDFEKGSVALYALRQPCTTNLRRCALAQPFIRVAGRFNKAYAELKLGKALQLVEGFERATMDLNSAMQAARQFKYGAAADILSKNLAEWENLASARTLLDPVPVEDVHPDEIRSLQDEIDRIKNYADQFQVSIKKYDRFKPLQPAVIAILKYLDEIKVYQNAKEFQKIEPLINKSYELIFIICENKGELINKRKQRKAMDKIEATPEGLKTAINRIKEVDARIDELNFADNFANEINDLLSECNGYDQPDFDPSDGSWKAPLIKIYSRFLEIEQTARLLNQVSIEFDHAKQVRKEIDTSAHGLMQDALKAQTTKLDELIDSVQADLRSGTKKDYSSTFPQSTEMNNMAKVLVECLAATKDLGSYIDAGPDGYQVNLKKLEDHKNGEISGAVIYRDEVDDLKNTQAALQGLLKDDKFGEAVALAKEKSAKAKSLASTLPMIDKLKAELGTLEADKETLLNLVKPIQELTNPKVETAEKQYQILFKQKRVAEAYLEVRRACSILSNAFALHNNYSDYFLKIAEAETRLDQVKLDVAKIKPLEFAKPISDKIAKHVADYTRAKALEAEGAFQNALGEAFYLNDNLTTLQKKCTDAQAYATARGTAAKDVQALLKLPKAKEAVGLVDRLAKADAAAKSGDFTSAAQQLRELRADMAAALAQDPALKGALDALASADLDDVMTDGKALARKALDELAKMIETLSKHPNAKLMPKALMSLKKRFELVRKSSDVGGIAKTIPAVVGEAQALQARLSQFDVLKTRIKAAEDRIVTLEADGDGKANISAGVAAEKKKLASVLAAAAAVEDTVAALLTLTEIDQALAALDNQRKAHINYVAKADALGQRMVTLEAHDHRYSFKDKLVEIGTGLENAAKLADSGKHQEALAGIDKVATLLKGTELLAEMQAGKAPSTDEISALMGLDGGTQLLDEIVASTQSNGGLDANTKTEILTVVFKARFERDIVFSHKEGDGKGTENDKKALDVVKLYNILKDLPESNVRLNLSINMIEFVEDTTCGSGYSPLGKVISLHEGPAAYENRHNFGDPFEVGDDVIAACQPANQDPVDSFTWNTLHEVGHAVDDANNFMGRFGSGGDYGGWRDHKNDVSEVAAEISKQYKFDRGYAARYLGGTKEPEIPPPTDGVDAGEWENRRLQVRRHIDEARVGNQPWQAAGRAQRLKLDSGRVYHEAYPNHWVSYELNARKQAITGYQWRAPGEWFSELYAAYRSDKLKNESHPAVKWLSDL